MKYINNIKNTVKGHLSTTAMVLFLTVLISCDFSYDLAEANSKEDQRFPTALFGANVRGGDQWNQVDFANGSVSSSNYVWDFGDGSETSTDAEPNHAYPPLEGAYTVTLSASDANGLTDTYTSTVNIIPDEDNPLTDYSLFFDLINEGDNGEPVTIHSFSSYQVEKDAFATNMLDKNPGTKWTAQDGDIIAGDNKSDGEFVVFDLGASHQLRIIQFSTDAKSDPYGYQIWTSNTGTADADFTKLIPRSGDIQLSQSATADFQAHEIPETLNAKYVKLVSFGRFNAAGDTRKSAWNNYTQIEFYKEK